jgi:hypothetical protein
MIENCFGCSRKIFSGVGSYWPNEVALEFAFVFYEDVGLPITT